MSEAVVFVEDSAENLSRVSELVWRLGRGKAHTTKTPRLKIHDRMSFLCILLGYGMAHRAFKTYLMRGN
jgi:hypothetical protein